MIKRFFILLLAIVASVGMGWALTPLSGDVWDDNTKTLTVNSNPDDYYNDQGEIKRLVISSSVTEIGEQAFSSNYNLQEVIAYNGLQVIDQSAFVSCPNLESVILPSTLQEVKYSAFSYCENLKYVTINASSLEEYAEYAFDDTHADLKIYVPEASVATYKYFWPAYASKFQAIPSSLAVGDTLKVGDAMYSATDVYVDAGYLRFQIKASFLHTISAISVSSENIKVEFTPYAEEFYPSGSYAALTNWFYCSSEYTSGDVTAITVVSGAGTLADPFVIDYVVPAPAAPANSCGDGVIWELNDGALTISYTGTGTGVMDNYAKRSDAPWYSYNEDITSVTITDGVKSVGSYSFGYYGNLVTVTIGNDVETIGEYAFGDCYKFTTLNLGNSIKHIGDRAFMWAKVLTGFTLPSTLETIGEYAFLQNKVITSLTIPSNVTSIGPSAFMYCVALTSVTVEATTPPTLGATVFEGVTTSSIPLHVPSGSVAAYTAADQWNAFDIQDPTPAYETVMNLINEIPNPVVLTDECKAKIDAARAAYNGLSNEDKALVTNYSTLQQAETDYANAKQAADQAAADPVIAKINEIPSPMTAENTKLSVYPKVQDARAAYDALTADQKALVSNYSRLTDAEDAFAAIGGGGLPTGALTGAFSVGESSAICFSQGNLQATTADLGANWTWSFAANQWDFIGNAVANTAISDIKSVSTNGTVDMFGWSTAATYYGISNNPGGAYYTGDFIDWGTNAISNGGNIANAWHTLAHDEWDYLFNTRTTTSGIRYAKATVNGIPGIILLPDDWSATYYALSNTNDYEVDFNSNVITTSDWTNSLEANGVVFLPAAGERLGADVNEVGSKGHYWSSTFKTDYNAYCLSFNSYNLDASDYINRREGYSVRLVVAAPVNYIAEAQAAVDLINAIPNPVTLDEACLNAVNDAHEAYNKLSEAVKGLLEEATIAKLTTAEAAFENVMNIWLSGDCDAILWKDTTLTVREHAGEGNGAMADYNYMSRAPWYSAHWYDPQPNDIVIKSVTIEEGVTYFGDYAFAWMDGLKTVTIPASVTSIHQDAFYWSKAVDDIYLTVADTANLTWGAKGDSSFKPEKATRCHVPADLLTAYQEKFGTLNVTFIGDLAPVTPPTPEEQAAIDAVKAKISAIPQPVVYTEACKAAIDSARAAYDALATDVMKLLVDNYDVLTAAETTYANLKDVVVIEAKINELPSPMTEADLKLSIYDKVTGARAAYDALTADQKALVGNYSILTAAEAAFAPYVGGGTGVEGLLTTITVSNSVVNHSVENIVDINQDDAVLGENGWTSGMVVVSAKPGFTITKVESFQSDGMWGVVDEDTSSPFEVSITNGMTLTKLNVYGYEALSPIAQAQAAVALINAIPDPVVYPDSKAAIDAARTALDALSDEAKNLFVEADTIKLPNAEAAYADLLAAAVADVIAKIDALPSTPLTEENTKLSVYDKVVEARAAYDALTAEEKAAVTNLAKLEAIEEAFAAIGGGAAGPAFAINAGGDVITFAPGNLQATLASSTWTWSFAANQWDIIGNAAANTSVNGNGTLSADGTVDLFGWVGNSSTVLTDGMAQYGISNSLTAADYGNVAVEALKSDWSTFANANSLGGRTDWRLLTNDEWAYIINTRSAENRYCKATVNSVIGLVLFPDNYSHPSGVTAIQAVNTPGAAFSSNVWSAEDWALMATAGAAFLPAGGNRVGEKVYNVENTGRYWTSSSHPQSAESAYGIDFSYPGSNNVRLYGLPRYYGASIRLAAPAVVSAIAQAQAAVDLINAIPSPVTLDSKDAIEAARAAVDALDPAALSLIDDADMAKLTDAEAALTALNQAEADKVVAKINNIPQPVELKLATRDSIESARAAYDALTADQKPLVSNYQTLLDAEDALAALNPGGSASVDIVWDINTGIANVNPNTTSPAYDGITITTGNGNRFYQTTKDPIMLRFFFTGGAGSYAFAKEDGSHFTKVVLISSVKMSDWLINPSRIGTDWAVSDEDKKATWTGDADTVKIWDGASATDWVDVDSIVFTVSGTATALDSAQAVKDLIENIPTPVTLDSKSAIDAAREAYDALSDAAKGALDDATVATLTQAEADYAALIKSATDTKDLIDAIPQPVVYTEACKAAIDSARVAYDALSDELKPLVTNYSTLTNAEAAYQTLQDGVEMAIAKIDAIPATIEYNADCKDAILDARAAYDALSDEQKAAFPADELQKLTDAEAAYAALAAEIEHNVQFVAGQTVLAEETLALLQLPNGAPEVNGFAFDHWEILPTPMAAGLHIQAIYRDLITVHPQAYDTLMYNGLAQNLITAGVPEVGHLEYRIGEGAWGETLPQATNAGVYTIQYKLVREGKEDYIAPDTLMATIAKAPVTYIAPVAYDTLVYTAANQTLIIAGQTNDGTMQYTLTPNDANSWKTALPQGFGAGTYNVSFRVVADANHLDSIAPAPVAVTIAKAALTATADDKTVIYGDAIPTYTVTYEGWQGEDTISALTGTIAYTCAYAPTSNVGEYTITPSGVDAANYTITFVNGKVTVNQAALTITAENDTVTYGDAIPTYTATYSGFKNGDTINVVSNLQYFCDYAPTSNVGTYAIHPDSAVALNYAMTFVNGTITVNQAQLSITADDKEVEYGEEHPEFTASYEGWKNNDTTDVVTGLEFACEYLVTSNVGEYTIVPSGATAMNYAISFTNGKLTVNQAPLMITAEDKNVIYGDAVPTYTASYSGWKNDDSTKVDELVTGLTFACAYAVTSSVGEYTITPDSAMAMNYAISYTNGKVTVNQAALTITANDTAMIYGDEHPEFTASYEGWLNNDGPSVVSGLIYTTPYQPGSYIGTYAIVPSGATAQNYAITFVDGTLTVNKAVVNVTEAEAQVAKFADGHAGAVVLNGGKLNGIKLNDAVTHITTAAFSSAEVSEHLTITLFYELSGEAALLTNYDLQPTSEIFSTEGVIIEPFIPDTTRTEEQDEDQTEVQEGISVYAYGYCEGDNVGLKYHLNSGNPDQYKIEFEDSRFTNVDWSDLDIAGKDGLIYIDIPVDVPTGDYQMTVYFRDSRFDWLESQKLNVTFHVNLPETYVKPLFGNTIVLIDTCECFTDIQWYYRENSSDPWQPIPGATGHYYHAEGNLTGEYFVSAKMNGVPTYTCGQTDMETLYGGSKQAKVSAYPNPVVNTTTVTIEASDNYEHDLRIITFTGVEVESNRFEGEKTVVDMSDYPQGSYMFSVDGIVVKVMKK